MKDTQAVHEVAMALPLCIYQKIEIPLDFMPKRRIRRWRLRRGFWQTRM